ncbi:MAG: Ig-like domain-containing protein [Verrucomicrobia bacterium]|nr:Ig-like domain-containing protein [Verrucomicrobiota bacterium]
MKSNCSQKLAALVLAFGFGVSSAHAAAPATAQGLITGKEFSNITGTAIANLTGNPKFPDNPDNIFFYPYFEWAATGDLFTAPGNYSNNYGGQIVGYFYPPSTGDYAFFLAADDNAVLYLSPDSNPGNKKLIAQETVWSNPRQYEASGGNSVIPSKDSSQFVATEWATKDPVFGGAKITLQRGQPYYIEALFKEGGGGDNLSVAVLDPGFAIDLTLPIPGAYLSSDRNAGPVTFSAQPQSQTVDERGPVMFRVLPDGTPPYTYQWRKNGTDISGATSLNYTISSAAVADNNASYSVVVTGGQGNATSQNAVLTVKPDTVPPTIAATKGSPNLTEVTLSFSESVEAASANTAANYKISSASGSLNVTAASLSASGTSVTLTTANQTLGTKYTILTSNIKDAAATPNTIAANSKSVLFPTGKLVETNGFIVFEAENYDRNLDGLWSRDTERGNPSGGASMVNYNGAGGSESATQLEYDIDFKQAATYIIWYRASGNDGGDDSAWFHLDGERPLERGNANDAAMTGFSGALDFVWRADSFGGADPMSVDIDIAGPRVVGLARREDGSFFDKFILTTDTAFTPTGLGLPETREGAPGLPTATLTGPADGSKYGTGSTVTLSATAAGASGLDIARIQYSANGNAIGEATVSPFSFNWSNVPSGIHAIRATAFDEIGQSVTTANSAVITVGTPPPQALFVVGSDTLNASDAGVKARMESLGWQVVPKLAIASQTSDADGKQIIITSSTVGSGDVGNKFRDVAVPVLNWEAALQDNYLMTLDQDTVTRGGTAGATETQVNIVKAGDPLAAGLSAGLKTVSAGADYTWGVPAASATIVATLAANADQAAIYAYEKGATLIDGTTKAPARRVHFLMTDNAFAALNADGLKLFDAAVVWASGIEPKIPGAGVYSIGLNFGADEPNGAGTATLSATDKAGAPGVAQSNWNNLTTLSGSETGTIVANAGGSSAATSVQVDWTSNNTWSSTGRGEENNQFTGPDLALMTGYLDTGNATTTSVTISGLPSDLTGGGYDVYVYALGGVAGGRAGGYRILDAGTKAVLKDYVRGTSSDNPTDYVQVPASVAGGGPGLGNYLLFTGLSASSIIIEATTESGQAGGGTPRAPINAIQLVSPTSAPPSTGGGAISAARTATGLRLTFQGTLQSADTVAGPYTDVTGAASPLDVVPSGSAKFYRAKN